MKRLCGLRAWLEFCSISAEHRTHSSEGIAAATEAAKWYSKATRARPRLGIWRYGGERPWRRYRPRSLRSPILDANTFDAHFYAGHKLRARYQELRFQRRRRALVRGAFADLRRAYLSFAHTKLLWVRGRRARAREKRRDAFDAVAGAALAKIEALPREAAEDIWAEESEVSSVELSDGTVLLTGEEKSSERIDP